VSPTEQELTGRKLGRYQTVEKIGSGGMGMVYKAIDTDLDRPVAIKVLRPEVASPEYQRRFVLEAKTASALNHPNIVTVYEIGEADGVTFIAMEYVVGKRLDELIGPRGLPMGLTLQYAIQVADALAAAHVAGIIHRDIKPGNIMINPRGQVKVLDFGLAKLAELAVAGDQTISMGASTVTAMGMIVGTLAYMSPEQIEGKKIDTRSDVFSFGVVLYEMATGKRAFEHDNAVSTIIAIAGREPTPIREMIPNSSLGLEAIVTRCLRKDAGQRYQKLEDVRDDLEELREGPRFRPKSVFRAMVSQSRAYRSWWIVAACVLVAGGAFWALLPWIRKSTSPRAELRLERLTADRGISAYPALSADGKLLAYASDRGGNGNLDIFVQQVGESNPIRVTQDPSDESEPSFSPDGSQIAYHAEGDNAGVWTVPSLGGAPRLIARSGRRPMFSPNGKQILYWVGSGTGKVYLVDAAGGKPRELDAKLDSARYPVWSPDGNGILLLGTKLAKNKGTQAEVSDWWVVPAEGGEAVPCSALGVFQKAGMAAPLLDRYISPDAWTPQNEVIFSARLGGTTNIWKIAIAPGSHQVAVREWSTRVFRVASMSGSCRWIRTMPGSPEKWSASRKTPGPLSRLP
jgi:eukaryotic-like serine/threonine-protein kinase